MKDKEFYYTQSPGAQLGLESDYVTFQMIELGAVLYKRELYLCRHLFGLRLTCSFAHARCTGPGKISDIPYQVRKIYIFSITFVQGVT
jgi:hypothetical protein